MERHIALTSTDRFSAFPEFAQMSCTTLEHISQLYCGLGKVLTCHTGL